MIHEILPVGILQCNCSVYGDEQSREAMVIDPGDNVSEIMRVVEKHGLTVKAIVITHAHIDHIGGAEKLKELTGAPVYMNENDATLADHLDVQAQWLGVATTILLNGILMVIGAIILLAVRTQLRSWSAALPSAPAPTPGH